MTDITKRKAVFSPFSGGSNRHVYTINDLVPRRVKFIIAPDESMSGSMIRRGSLVAVELGSSYSIGNIYLIYFRGQQVLRKVSKENSQTVLLPSNPNWPPEIIGEDDEVRILGQVVWSFFFHGHISADMETVIKNLVSKDYDD